ncbi:DNA primase [Halopenitus sp. POP-27]|uniref:DNA primase n=1 Tax=Halopenitus sp. POP-27 TaxID=2994425 RepID=UPI002469668C|nr:DNA primase [Halopenitus sp. POP-27]
MDPLYARYPFFEAAREAVAGADVSLPALVASDAPAVERGRERVERALRSGTTASETPDAYDVTAELLSYPIARILVSLLESTAAVEKYASAEAATAADRIREDLEREDALRSTDAVSLDLSEVLREFDLDDAVQPAVRGTNGGAGSAGQAVESRVRGGSSGRPSTRDPEWFRIDVGPYLQLFDPEWGDRWRLVNRELRDGAVWIDRADLDRCLERAIRSRVLEGLPFEFADDDGISSDLETHVADLRRLLDERATVGSFDVVVPELFPPCMHNLIDKAEREAALSPPESLALMAFLTAIGMSPDEIVAFCADTSLDAEGIRYQTEYLRDEAGAQYPPPTCETLSAYGICHNEDDHWQVAGDPLAYYEARLEAAEDVVDWRDRNDVAEPA